MGLNEITCQICDKPMEKVDVLSTLVGYGRAECGRVHDDNCRRIMFMCPDKHTHIIHIRNTCPCGWKGKQTCFCHEGVKKEFQDE